MFPVAGALMEPTIPTGQCGLGRSCLQKNQMGVDELVIVKFQVGTAAPSATPVGMRMLPESKPSESGSQGLAKDDCVTEWLPGEPE